MSGTETVNIVLSKVINLDCLAAKSVHDTIIVSKKVQNKVYGTNKPPDYLIKFI